jgi:sugar O-acyltransferase (sialic acid O-acetyltransferase NeuD family)
MKVILIGYSGHSFVIADIFKKKAHNLLGYCDSTEKKDNPFDLDYLGIETTPEVQIKLKENSFFISIGSNQIRSEVFLKLKKAGLTPINAFHPFSVIGAEVSLGNGVMIAANSTINALAKIGNGVICNTACIIEHECQIGDFAHIAPGAVLAGNVTIGERTFVGANAVIKQGIIVGKDVTIGAGSVIIKDIPDGATVVGNPGKIIKI